MDERLRTLVIDGEPMAIDKLRRFARKVDSLQIVKECKDTAEALEYMNENPVDVIFTEVAMPGAENGIEFIESLPFHPLVVFVTAQTAYAVDAYRLSAVDFISKPYGMAEFQRATHRVMEAYRHRNMQGGGATGGGTKPEFLFIRNEKEYEKVELNDIRYISGDAEYLSLHVAGREKPLREKSSFAAIKRLLSPWFVQIHRSSIINIKRISSVGKMYVVMDDGTRIRVSESNRDRFYSHVASLTVGKKSAAAGAEESDS